MENKDKIINAITELAWAELLTHKDNESDTIHLSGLNPNTLSFIDGEPIMAQKAKDLIKQWVTESINKHGQVICYSCRDNAEISIEDLEPIKLAPDYNENLEYLSSQQTIPADLEGILYFDFD